MRKKRQSDFHKFQKKWSYRMAKRIWEKLWGTPYPRPKPCTNCGKYTHEDGCDR